MSKEAGGRLGLRALRSLCVGSIVVAACAGGGGGGGGGDAGSSDGVPTDVKAPFGAYGARTTFTYGGAYPTATSSRFVAGFVGTKSIGGTDFQTAKVGRDVSSPADLGSPSTKGLEIYGNRTASTLVFGGVADTDVAAVTMSPPVTVDTNPTVGEKRTYEATATLKLGANGTPTPVSGKLDMTLVEAGATATTASGTYSGTQHFSGTLSVTGSGLPSNLTGGIGADVWVHPELGVLAAKVPVLGIDLGFEGEEDYGPATSGMNACRKVAVLTDASPTFALSTYDRKNAFDADKNTHAKMLLELRFAKESDALALQTSDVASLQIQFGTAIGYYDHTLVESPVSVFHPEENGKGYHYWYALVDQAAKNEPGDAGIAYRVQASKPSGMAAVRATARILYKLVP